jgi:NhaC family Na+:H+ antiporter
MSTTLGVSTFLYFPYCIFNLVNPLLALIYGFTGFKVMKLEPEPDKADGTPAPTPAVLAAPHVPVSK